MAKRKQRSEPARPAARERVGSDRSQQTSIPRARNKSGRGPRTASGKKANPTVMADAAQNALEGLRERTEQGHLASDFIQHPRGTLIADFAVDWRTPKSSLRRDAALRAWLATMTDVVRANPTTRIRISGCRISMLSSRVPPRGLRGTQQLCLAGC